MKLVKKPKGLILAGKVRDINGKVFDKPGQQVLIGSEFFIDSEPMFVSRGGEKLLEAFKRLEIKVKDKICIDAGISTGGLLIAYCNKEQSCLWDRCWLWTDCMED